MLSSQMEVNTTVRASSMYFCGVLLLFVHFLFVPFVENHLIVYSPDRLIE